MQPDTDKSVGDQLGSVIPLARPDATGRSRFQPPRRDPSVGSGQLAGFERFADQPPDTRLVGGLSGEKHPQHNGFGHNPVGDVVRREWAWRRMIPASA